MGVIGLWQLLEPLGRPVSLESLENKVLAVDASIWIHQAVHGFRDKSGNPLSNSHLIGMFHRLCKLLSYRIKPVFVFDGTVPLLKRETMAARRERQKDAVREAEKSRKQILTRHIKLRAIEEVIKKKDDATTSSSSTVSTRNGDKSSLKVDLYELPSMPPLSSSPTSDFPLQLFVSSEDDDSNDFRSSLSNSYQDLDDVDVESDDFKQLPLEIQQEILIELKEKLKRKSWTRLAAMPDDPEEIGKHQIQQLLIRRKIQKKLDEVGKMMGTFLSEALIGDKLSDTNDLSSERQSVEVRRIMSEDYAHYVLFKTVPKKYNDDWNESVVDNGNSSTLIDKSSSEVDFVEVMHRKKEKLIEPEELSIDKDVDSVSIASSELIAIKNVPHESVVVSSETSDEGVEDVDSIKDTDSMRNSVHINTNEIEAASKGNNIKLKSTDVRQGFECEVTNRNETDISGMIEMNQSHLSSEKTVDKVVPANCSLKNFEIKEIEPQATVTGTVDAPLDYVIPAVSVCDEDSDDDFVEVESVQTVSELSPVSDELFPLEVFKVNEMETDEVVPSNLTDSVHGSDQLVENGSDMYADRSPLVDISLTMDNEELKLLSEQLEQEVVTLVQEKGRHERVAATITAQMYVEIQELLKLFGIPYIVSPAEAEAQCATLDLLDLTEGTITDDSDIWLFGGRRVYKNFFNRDKDVFFFKDTDIEQRLGLDRKKLIAVALLTGSDYTEGIKGIGAVSALEVLAEFGGQGDGIVALKQFRDWWDKTQNRKMTNSETKIKKTLQTVNLHSGFPSAVVVNAYLEPNVDSSKELFSWAHPDLDELRHFACNKLSWSKDKLDGLLLPVIKRLNSKETQRHMSDYFQTADRELPTTSRGIPRSRRLQRAIKRVRGSSDDIALDPKTKAVRILRSKRVSAQGRGSKNSNRPTNNEVRNDVSQRNLGLSESSSGEEFIP